MGYTVIEYRRCPLCLIHLFLFNLSKTCCQKNCLISSFLVMNFSVHEYVFEYCPKCGVHHPVLIKADKVNSGKQMYRCKHCNKRFVVDHGQLTYYSHQSEQKWNQLIDDTVAGHSLKTSADHISVCEETAFRMRHKLLYFLEQMSFPLRISETN